LDGSVVELLWTASDVLAFDPSAPHTCAQPLDERAEFQPGDATDDGSALWSSSIDALPEADELDIDLAQFVQHLKKVRVERAMRSHAQVITTPESRPR
jgi:hypothetical protein